MVTNATGIIQTTDILTQKCPDVSSVVQYSVHGGGPSFAALLKDLVELLIEQGGYVIRNMQGVLQGVSRTLEEL